MTIVVASLSTALERGTPVGKVSVGGVARGSSSIWLLPVDGLCEGERSILTSVAEASRRGLQIESLAFIGERFTAFA